MRGKRRGGEEERRRGGKEHEVKGEKGVHEVKEVKGVHGENNSPSILDCDNESSRNRYAVDDEIT